MATLNAVGNSLTGSTGTGAFVGSASPTFTGSPLIGASPYAVGIITPWVDYVPTFTGFGTVGSSAIWSRRVGDNLQIRGLVVTGTPTGTEARMTLGFNGTNSNVTSSNTVLPSKSLAGTVVTSTAGANSQYVLIESNVGYITFSVQSAGNNGFAKALGTIWGAGITISLFCEIPIDTWP